MVVAPDQAAVGERRCSQSLRFASAICQADDQMLRGEPLQDEGDTGSAIASSCRWPCVCDDDVGRATLVRRPVRVGLPSHSDRRRRCGGARRRRAAAAARAPRSIDQARGALSVGRARCCIDGADGGAAQVVDLTLLNLVDTPRPTKAHRFGAVPTGDAASVSRIEDLSHVLWLDDVGGRGNFVASATNVQESFMRMARQIKDRMCQSPDSKAKSDLIKPRGATKKNAKKSSKGCLLL